MRSRKEKDMKRKNEVLAIQLKRPFLTGLMLALGFGLGSALLGLLTIAAPMIYMYIQTTMS